MKKRQIFYVAISLLMVGLLTQCKQGKTDVESDSAKKHGNGATQQTNARQCDEHF